MNLLQLVFPKGLYCISCGRPLPAQGEGGLALCDKCAGEIRWVTGRVCAKCGRPLAGENPGELCRECAADEELRFSKGYACAIYEGRAAELVRDMKYREKAWYADTVAALMADRYFSAADPFTGELPCCDCVIAVPMAAGKKAARGYDQAALLAHGLSIRIGAPCLSGALVRVRETDVMSSLSKEERRQNLSLAFSVRCDKIEAVKAKRVLLVDDVYTTGSSVSACADTLLAAGAAGVDVIVFAVGADSPKRVAVGSDASRRVAEG